MPFANKFHLCQNCIMWRICLYILQPENSVILSVYKLSKLWTKYRNNTPRAIFWLLGRVVAPKAIEARSDSFFVCHSSFTSPFLWVTICSQRDARLNHEASLRYQLRNAQAFHCKCKIFGSISNSKALTNNIKQSSTQMGVTVCNVVISALY